MTDVLDNPTTSPISTSRHADVLIVTSNNPPVNALGAAVRQGLVAAIEEAEADDAIKAVVIAREGQTFFAGADISEFGGPEEGRRIGATFREALSAVAAIPRFTVAAITGVALGGGCELALACDWRICAENARLGQPEILLGIIPGGGGTQRLPRLIGAARAKELVLTGRQVKADEALRIGLVDEVVPAAEVQERALAKAAELASGAVVAEGYAKAAIDEGVETTLAWGLDRELELFEKVFTTEDAATGVRSFLEAGPGKARFSGR